MFRNKSHILLRKHPSLWISIRITRPKISKTFITLMLSDEDVNTLNISKWLLICEVWFYRLTFLQLPTLSNVVQITVLKSKVYSVCDAWAKRFGFSAIGLRCIDQISNLDNVMLGYIMASSTYNTRPTSSYKSTCVYR